MTTQITGEVLQTNKPGSLSLAVRQPLGVCVGMAPWNAPVILGTRGSCHGARLRQHGRIQGVGANTRDSTRLIVEVLHERRPTRRRNQLHRPFTPRTHRMWSRALVGHPDVAPRQLHRLDKSRADHRQAWLPKHLKPVLLELGGKSPLVVLARCRRSRCGQRSFVWLLHEPGPDLHVDGAPHR